MSFYGFETGLYYPDKVKPKIIEKTFDDRILECWDVMIDGEDYEECCKASKKRWSLNKERGMYNDGFLNKSKGSYSSERTGLLGEVALAKVLDAGVDFAYRENGDQYDFKLPLKLSSGDKNITIDIKTASRDYDCVLITAKTEKGFLLSLKCDIYIASYIRGDNLKDRYANVILAGWNIKEFVGKKEMRKARIKDAKNLNYELYYNEVKSMDSFMELYNYKEALKRKEWDIF